MTGRIGLPRRAKRSGDQTGYAHKKTWQMKTDGDGKDNPDAISIPPRKRFGSK